MIIDAFKHSEMKEPLEKLQESAKSFKYPAKKIHSIEYGELTPIDELVLDEKLLKHVGSKSIDSATLIQNDNELAFIDTELTKPTSGKYLITINDVYQLAEMKTLPDGVTYLIDGNEMFPISPEATKIIGKVTGLLSRT